MNDNVMTRVENEVHKEVMLLKVMNNKKSFSEVIRELIEFYKENNKINKKGGCENE